MPLCMAGQGRTFSTSWSHPHVRNIAQTTTSAVTISTLEKFQTMMRVHSLRAVSSTFPLGLEADKTLQKLTPEHHLGLLIIVNFHNHVPFSFTYQLS